MNGVYVVQRNARCDNSPRLSIITVVKDDSDGLGRTASSIAAIASRDMVEYIVWVSSRSANIDQHLDEAREQSDLLIVGEDSGIFDAMNRALSFARGSYILFLNARDIMSKPIEVSSICGPCLIPVSYINYFGSRKSVEVSRTVSFGIPYCHQGMILPRFGYRFDTDLKFGADYLALLDFNFAWPLPLLASGHIQYDTTGVSTVHRWTADKWTARVIVNRFGYSRAATYLSFCLIKLGVKRVFDLTLALRSLFLR